MKRLPWQKPCFLTILCLFGAIGFQNLINIPSGSLAYTNSFLSLALFSFWLFGLLKLTKREDWDNVSTILTPCFFFLICFVGSMAAGVQLDQTGNMDFSDWRLYFSVLFTAAASTPLLAAFIRELERRSLRGSLPGRAGSQKGGRPSRSFWITFGILFLSYIPTLLASYPGFFVYDAEAECYMVFTEKYSTYQPLLHVILLGWTLRLIHHITGSYNAGILFYTLAQIAVLSACFSYEINFLRKAGVKRSICNLGTAFLALFPTVSMFVCCSTKDTLFSGGVILFTTLLLELAKDADRFWNTTHKRILLAVSMLFILFFRNNGIYALMLFLVLFAVFYRKTWRKWISTIAVTLLIYLLLNQGLIFAFHAGKGPIAEMFCVPMQQLARVYREESETFSEEDTETLYSLIPQVILEDYNPKLADNIKRNFMADNFKSDPGKYISLWVRTGIRHFDIYVNSFLENTYGYWYPDTVLDGYRGVITAGREYGDSCYFGFGTENPGERSSLLPPLEKFYEKISLEIYQQKIPVVSMLFSVGFWHWVYLFAALFLLISRHKKQAFSLSFIGLVYLTVLLGPIALVRYVIYLFFAVPLILALLFDPVPLSGETAQESPE